MYQKVNIEKTLVSKIRSAEQEITAKVRSASTQIHNLISCITHDALQKEQWLEMLRSVQQELKEIAD